MTQAHRDQDPDFAAEHDSVTASGQDTGGPGQADREQQASRSYAAPAEVVYDTITDPHQLSQWLPSDLRLSVLNNDLIQVTRGQTDVTGYRLSVDRAQRSVSWQPIGSVGWQGTLRVRPTPAGGSTAELSLRAADAERAKEDLAAAMDETLRRLEQLIPPR